MTRQRDLKTKVRARMSRTGESYTTARTVLLRRATRPPRTGGEGVDPFQRLTRNARRAFDLAQQEAELARNRQIGTEHLLLGLLGLPDASAAKVLARFGIFPALIRERLEALRALPQGRASERRTGPPKPAPHLKKVIEHAFREALRSRQTAVHTTHLLLGILIEGEGPAAQALYDMGLTLARLLAEPVSPPDPRARRLVDTWLPREHMSREVVARPRHSWELHLLLEAAAARATDEGGPRVRLTHLVRSMDQDQRLAVLAVLLDEGSATLSPPSSVLRTLAAVDQAQHRREVAVTQQRNQEAAAAEREEQRLRSDLRRSLRAWGNSLRTTPSQVETRGGAEPAS